jgi:RNA polymerase sigma-70 factor (family 1)
MLAAEANRIEDKLLLGQMQEDNAGAFEAIYEKYWDPVYAAALKRLRDADVAQDICQEIFLQVWQKRHHLIENLPAYLFTAVRNNVLKWMEKEKKYTPIPELLLQVQAHRDQADADLLLQEFMQAYEALVATLTASQQVIFRMRYHQELSTEEIASQLNVSRKTVQNQLGRSVAQLREFFLALLVLWLIRLL